MDKGASWVVVAAAFVSNFLNGGFLQIMGVYMVAWQDYFDVDATTIAAVASELSLVSRLSGLISGALCKRFGCRCVLMVSAVISVGSTLLGSFATTLWHLHIYAFFAGFGYGLAFTPCFIAVSYHFRARLGLANGIISAGNGVGILVMAPIIELLCDKYSWKGALFVHSAITANRFCCALLLKPSILEVISLEQYRIARANATANNMGVCKPPRTTTRSANDLEYNCVQDDAIELRVIMKDHETDRDETARQSEVALSSVRDEQKGTFTLLTRLKYLLKCLDESFDISYFVTMPSFLILSICTLATAMSTMQCRFYILPKMVFDLNVPRIKASFGMTILGACITLVRAVHGLFLDYGLISVPNMFLLGMSLTGTALLINPFVETFIGQMILAGVFGLGDGLIMPMINLMAKALVRTESLSNAVGMQFALGGIGLFAGIQTMGRLYDATGSYDTPFFIFGVVQWAAVVLLLYLTKCSRWRSPSATKGS